MRLAALACAILAIRVPLAGGVPRPAPLPAVFEVSQSGFFARAAGQELAVARDGRVRVRFAGQAAAAGIAIEAGSGTCDGALPLPSFTRRYGAAPGLAPHYAAVRCRDAWPGIDWVWKADADGIRFEVLVSAFAPAAAARIRFRGAADIRVDGSGALRVRAQGGELRFASPRAFEGHGTEVRASYAVEGGAVRFNVARSRLSEPLLIDPLLTAISFLGGGGFDAAYAVALDATGNIYVAGETDSSDFSTPDQSVSVRQKRDAFVAKLAPDGRTLVYTTILSGLGNDAARALAADDAGYVSVAGSTAGGGFPLAGNPLRATPAGAEDAFAARLDPSGKLVYSTYIGGAGIDIANGIAVHGGDLYVAGYTSSSNFPVTSGAPQTQYRGTLPDAFLSRLNPQTGVLVYSTLFGGLGNDVADAVAVTSAGEACMAGTTGSDGLPAVAALRQTRAGGNDAFLACLNAAGTAWTQVSYLGGASEDTARGIAIDVAGNRHLAGSSFSPDFPTTADAPQTANRGDYDAFLAVISPTGALVRSTLIGGKAADSAMALALDDFGRDWVAGYTNSPDLPSTGTESQAAGSSDAFVCRLSSAGGLETCVYAGGAGDDRATAIAARAGTMVLTGFSASAPFTSPSALWPSQSGYNAFLALAASPLSQTVSPAASAGDRQTFTATIAATNGLAAIGKVMLLVGSSTSTASACNVAYLRSANQLLLMDDTGGAPLGPLTPGSAGSVSNGQCTLLAQGSSASAAGSTLTIAFALRFAAAFAGAKNVYLRTYGSPDSTAWIHAGTYTVQTASAPPSVAGVAFQRSAAGMSFDISTADPNGPDDPAWVLFLIDRDLTGVGACYVVYRRDANELNLVDDSGAVWLAPLVAGTPSLSGNSQCTLSGAASRTSVSGAGFTVTLGLSFAPSFAGQKRLYVLVWDRKMLSSGWQDMGAVTIP